MPLVESRHAEALFDISIQRSAADLFEGELKSIAGTFSGNEELKAFLMEAQIDILVKKEAIKKIFSGKIDSDLLSFLLLLLDKGRITILQAVSREFSVLLSRHRNILNLKIISAAPLDSAQIEKIKEKYRVLFKASSVSAEFIIDKSLLGGVRVVSGDKVFDGSVKTVLEDMQHMITES